MTNIEKVKRILDAGHWVKATDDDSGIIIFTSYSDNSFSYTDVDYENMFLVHYPTLDNCTIEVIQRIPTQYKTGDKVLVLSNPTDNQAVEDMVGKVMEVNCFEHSYYTVWNKDKTIYYIFSTHCLAPAFDEPKDEPTLSGKEAKIVIDGKEYSATLKLI